MARVLRVSAPTISPHRLSCWRSETPMKKTLLLVAVLVAVALPLYAQLATGNIYGIVTDESGAALPGAAVAVKGPGGSFNTTSGSDGRFRILNLSPGAYKITT